MAIMVCRTVYGYVIILVRNVLGGEELLITGIGTV